MQTSLSCDEKLGELYHGPDTVQGTSRSVPRSRSCRLASMYSIRYLYMTFLSLMLDTTIFFAPCIYLMAGFGNVMRDRF